MPGKHRQWSTEQSRWLYPGDPGYDDAFAAEDLPIDANPRGITIKRKDAYPQLGFSVRVGTATLLRCPMDEDGVIVAPLGRTADAVMVQVSLIDLLRQSHIDPAEAQKALTRYKKEFREKGGDDNDDQREVQSEPSDRAVSDHGEGRDTA